jgi:glycosyltransferase involved in cell wall biosynthesis
MKIGIEAQRIFRKKKHGMDIVILEVLKQFQQMDTGHQFFVYAQPDEDNTALQAGQNMEICLDGPVNYPLWEQRRLPRLAQQNAVQLLHCTSNTAPVKKLCPLVITIHDIIYLEKWMITEGSWYQRLGNLYRRWNVPRVAHKADIVITVSNYEKKRIEDALGLPSDRVRTVYNACGSHFAPIADKNKLEAFRKEMNLPEKFLLFLGNTDPKKNLPNVMRALWLLKQKKLLEHKIVMPDFGEGELKNLLASLGASKLFEDVKLTGYIPNSRLPFLYNLADIFLYPSLRESFGIPIIESMACGVPVITSNTSAMPEVAGVGALLINPAQPEELAIMIEQVLGNAELRKQAVDYGLVRASQFSWRNTAQQVLDIYNELL